MQKTRRFLCLTGKEKGFGSAEFFFVIKASEKSQNMKIENTIHS